MPKKTMLGILTLTHSSRKTDLLQCSKDTLSNRYASPDRLKDIVSFEQLASCDKYVAYCGGVSLYAVYKDKNSNIYIKNKGYIKSNNKIQHTEIINQDNILVAYESYLELWKLYKPVTETVRFNKNSYFLSKRYDHPHFAGIHTVSKLTDNLVVLSASAPDAILILNLDSGKLIHNIRMPRELYGENYELTDEMDLRKHYIHNDLQTAHINSAFPAKNKNCIIISALIPGAVGCFNIENGKYVELVRGYIGCHGARVNNEGLIYFTDSPSGKLIFINNSGQIINELPFQSNWMHDALQITDNIYALSLADKNEMRIVNIESGKILSKKRYLTSTLGFSPYKHDRMSFFTKLPFFYGNSTQFLSMYSIADN